MHGSFQDRIYSCCGHIFTIWNYEGELADHHGGPFSRTHCGCVYARGFSRCGRRGFSRSDYVLLSSQRDSPHVGDRGQLFGAGGGAYARRIPTVGKREGVWKRWGERTLFCRTRRFSRATRGTARGIPLGKSNSSAKRKRCGSSGVWADGAACA